MKKLLYITVDSKPEELSSCRTVGRALVNRFMSVHDDFELEEMDLYEEYVPRPRYKYFNGQSTLIEGKNLLELTPKEQEDVASMTRLCDQFVSATIYIVAAPMWSLSFPALLKDYIDCIVQAEKTITFKKDKPEGILNDRPRTFVYVQSSGANIPWLIGPVLNKGLNYVGDIMKYIGISKFMELLVDGTGTTQSEKLAAIEKAKSKIEDIVKQVQL